MIEKKDREQKLSFLQGADATDELKDIDGRADPLRDTNMVWRLETELEKQ